MILRQRLALASLELAARGDAQPYSLSCCNTCATAQRLARWLATPANLLAGHERSAFQVCVIAKGPRWRDAGTLSVQ